MPLFCFYILSNASRTFLLVGATENLNRQFTDHEILACSFSKEIQPAHLIYFENYTTLKSARSRAEQVKTWCDCKKWRLIMQANPLLNELLHLDAETSAA
ncbi:MAG: GIY-YIG nuclease family protein [Flavobacterium sp.]|uniref:hypothetical protein n=1 Tax=Flavobacterium sp. TaxID=239 RepID=UPI001211D3FD|nr:hypothetical protein [Flavobacterium sp.]RZJ66753.1 MAG: GIY-YIG nuclease family protein [Flavobacterium sp.]